MPHVVEAYIGPSDRRPGFLKRLTQLGLSGIKR